MKSPGCETGGTLPLQVGFPTRTLDVFTIQLCEIGDMFTELRQHKSITV
jgi:hypothetical protein